MNNMTMYCNTCGNQVCDCEMNVAKTEGMLQNCAAPKTKLSNGMFLKTTQRAVGEGMFMDIYVTDADGIHVASQSVSYKTAEQKKEKIANAINQIKLEIVGYEVGKLAEKNGNNIPELLAHIAKRFEQLKIKKAA